MKSSLATAISVGAVLAAGGIAYAVNTSVLDATVTAEQAPAGSARRIDEPSTTDTAVAGTGTTVADPGQTVDAQVAATTAPPATRSAYDVQGLGIVTLEQTEATLAVVSVATEPGVSADSVQESATRVEVRFVDASGQSVKFHADVIGGRVVTSVMREPAGGSRDGARPPRGDGRRDGGHDDDGRDGGEGREDDDD